eukprot:8339859-Pyramimonas_sp.AAC.1
MPDGAASTSLALAGRRLGSMSGIQIHHRTTPKGRDTCQAFFSHPTCDPTAAERPTAPPMDFLLYPDYHAQVTGNPRVETQPENPHVRATADEFDQSQLTRGSVYASGVPGQIPHSGYLATPMDSDVIQQAPGLVAPSSMGELRPEILA